MGLMVLQFIEPVVENEPFIQFEHIAFPDEAVYLPETQLLHTDPPVIGWYIPAVHKKHNEAFDVDTVPTPQLLQTLESELLFLHVHEQSN